MPGFTPKETSDIVMPLAHGLSAGLRQCLAQGVSPVALIQVLLDQVVGIVALVEPAGVRAEMAKGIVDSIPGMIREAVAKTNTTPSGVIVPRAFASETRHAI